MKVLFAIPELLLSEPLGVMQLSAVCRANNHQTKLVILKKQSIIKAIEDYKPELIAYSAMTPDAELFARADDLVKNWLKGKKGKVARIMGGPHPTYFPEVLNQRKLDAVCLGEGDRSILKILERLATGQGFSGIPNILTPAAKNFTKELIGNLNELPFVDREIIYESLPYYRAAGLRSFLTSRGCPYNCTYCYNHIFNDMFKGCGPIIRRRSVDNLIEEIKLVIKKYPPVRYLRFADDTFVHQVDAWLLEFAEKYKKEINLPFYCLMRSNTLTENTAKILASAGCRSIGMAVETGDEQVRNKILKRNLPDQVVINSFQVARKHQLKTYGNTMLAIPGTSLTQDFQSFIFTKKLRLSAPTFGIFSPYPRTELTEYAQQKGLLNQNFAYTKFGLKSVLNSYTQEEKEWQLRLVYLAPLFCALPDGFIPLLKLILKWRLTKFYAWVGALYTSGRTYAKIFPGVLPKNPVMWLKIVRDAILYSRPKPQEKIAR